MKKIRIFIWLTLCFTNCTYSDDIESNSTLKNNWIDEVRHIELIATKTAPQSEKDILYPNYIIVPVDYNYFHLFIQNKNHEALHQFFSIYWETHWDWFLNGVLYYYFSISPSPIMKYFPNDVENWRNERKEQDYLFWINYFDTLSG